MANNLDAHECLQVWYANVRLDSSTRWTKSDRPKHIQKLMEYFIDHGVDKDTAQFMKNKVISFLVTEQGMKGKDGYKNWKENTENDYDDAVQIAYVMPDMKKTNVRPLRDSDGHDPRIVKWVKGKYGDHVGKNIILLAHTPSTQLWFEFIKEHHNEYFKGSKK